MSHFPPNGFAKEGKPRLASGAGSEARQEEILSLIRNIPDSHVKVNLIELIELTEVFDESRIMRNALKRAYKEISSKNREERAEAEDAEGDNVKSQAGETEEAPDKMIYDDIVSDLYGPHEKLQAMSQLMIDGAHEMDVNTTGLGAVFMGEADKDGANTWNAVPPNAGATEGAGRVFIGAGSADKNSTGNTTR